MAIQFFTLISWPICLMHFAQPCRRDSVEGLVEGRFHRHPLENSFDPSESWFWQIDLTKSSFGPLGNLPSIRGGDKNVPMCICCMTGTKTSSGITLLGANNECFYLLGAPVLQYLFLENQCKGFPSGPCRTHPFPSEVKWSSPNLLTVNEYT